MSYLTRTTKRPHGDEWVQVKCDGEGCDALGPRVEVRLARGGRAPEHAVALAKLAAGFTPAQRIWRRRRGGRAIAGLALADLCRACAVKARILDFIAELGGPFGPPEHESTDP